MWEYNQSTGEITQDGEHVAWGYSGGGDGKNNPDMQDVHDIGPIPQGVYDIQAPRDTKDHGPYVLPLAPQPYNQMFGRSGFLIHGDSIPAPGTASHGCIIASRITRMEIWESSDHTLQVVKEKA